MPPSRRPDEIRRWLRQRPPLKEIQARFPEEWRAVQRELADVAAAGDAEAVKRYAAKVARPPQVVAGRTGGRSADEALVAAEVRQHLAASALRQMGVAAATGVSHGRVRFNLINGYLAQRLLFARGLERKPVSRPWFSVIWPLLWQKRFLMPLVEPKGIYCFYSATLIERLAGLIADRPALEIAAGDGSLSRFLAGRGVRITATDDHSWSQIEFPEDVQRLDAREALRRYAPQVVLASWPPASNPFERWVFETASVELYIVIGSRHEFAAGNWDAYRRQRSFEMQLDEELSRLVLPPEIDPAVYVFRRTSTPPS